MSAVITQYLAHAVLYVILVCRCANKNGHFCGIINSYNKNKTSKNKTST